VYDPTADKIGHMPFTPEFYAALGTFITRKVRAFKGPSYKVMALDCDNTLWKGVCGEVGALGVEIDENFNYLQEFLLEKYQEGFLLVLCSKNNENDVWEVFDRHPKMKLRRDQITAHRLNWKPKSDNLLAISQELNLGVDSIIFLDDSGFETEQMSSALPGVLSLTLPENSNDIPGFMDHAWVFDHFHITEEDRLRNSMYKTEKERKDEQVKHSSLNDFLQSLQIVVNIRPLEEQDIDRAVQLSVRTNQFNLNGVRKTREEIIKLMDQENSLNRIIDVKDRFGDYGVVGLILAKEVQITLIVESFLLSCRVLGRGVENIILSELKKHCMINQLTSIKALFQATTRNMPFIEFLGQTQWIADDEANSYNFPIKYSSQELLCK
jgi:FkbH-like protein